MISARARSSIEARSPLSGPTRRRDWDRFAPLFLIALVLAILLPGTATLPLVDRDEPRFATATREMMERGEWVIPTFNGHERFDKPVLTYWLMRGAYTVAGKNELGARLHAILSSLVLVIAVWHAGRRWFSPVAGLAAATTLATCLQVFIHGRLALADMPTVAAVTLACIALAELLAPDSPNLESRDTLAAPTENGSSVRRDRRLSEVSWRWVLWISLGIGFLAKGPVALAVPALALIVWRALLWRKPVPWSALRAGWGLFVLIAIIAAWGVPALIATHGRFWDVGIGQHVVQRGFERFNGRGYSPFFYLMTAPLSLFPWFGFAGVVLVAARQRWSARVAWLVSWLVAPYVIFTAYATQLPHYVLPGFPAFFLLLGLAVTETRHKPRWAWISAGAFLVLSGTLLVTALALASTSAVAPEFTGLKAGLRGAVLVLLGLTLLPLAMWRKRVLPALGLIFVIIGGIALARGLQATSLTRAIGDRLADGNYRDARRIGYGFAEPSLVFYSGPSWTFVDTEAELVSELARPGALVVVTVSRETDPVPAFIGRPLKWTSHSPPRALAAGGGSRREVSGFNLGRSRWQELTLWSRP